MFFFQELFRSDLKNFTSFGNSSLFSPSMRKQILFIKPYYNFFLVLLSGLDVLGLLDCLRNDDDAEAGALGVERSGCDV